MNEAMKKNEIIPVEDIGVGMCLMKDEISCFFQVIRIL